MTSIESIKAAIKKLYETGAMVHITVSINRPKISKQGIPAKIVGVYPHIFQIEECSGEKRRYSLQYTDMLIGQIKIAELS